MRRAEARCEDSQAAGAGEVAVSPCRNWLERHLVRIKRYERRDEEKVKVQAGIMAQFYNPQ